VTRLLVIGALIVGALELAHLIVHRLGVAERGKPEPDTPEPRRDDGAGWRRFDPVTGQMGEPSEPRTRAPWLHRHKRNRWRIGPLG
jgi:hypothetical protein